MCEYLTFNSNIQADYIGNSSFHVLNRADKRQILPTCQYGGWVDWVLNS